MAIQQYVTKDFDWDPVTKTFTQEISVLSHIAFGKRVFQITRDNPNTPKGDLGICITNDKTGKTVAFIVTRQTYDASHEDVTSWELSPMPHHISENPKLNGVKVIIYND